MRFEIMKILNNMRSEMLEGEKVFISSKPEVLSVGTIELPAGIVHMAYDPMIPTGSYYLIGKEEYDNRFGVK